MPEDHIQKKTDGERGRFATILDQLGREFARVQAERDTALRALAIISRGLETKTVTDAVTAGASGAPIPAPPATPDAKPADCPATMTAGECEIVKACIAELLEQGFELSVDDGEETTVRRSRDPAAILAAMATTGSDYLLPHKAGAHDGADPFGWVRFVYGNDSAEVLSDHTVNLEPYLVKTNETIREVDERGI